MILLLSALGLCWILMYGDIFEAFRYLLPKLFKCSLCLGFWCGMVVYAASQNHFPIDGMAMINHGLGSAGLCWFAEHARKVLDELISLCRALTEEA